MVQYSPDIAGIMSCLCNALTDDARGIEGCVIQSSDNDNDDGEIFITVPDGHGGTTPYLIKVAPSPSAEPRPPVARATLTLDVTYDPQVTDAESIAAAADRLLETALSTPGILDDYGNPTFDAFYVLTEPKSGR